MRAAAAAAAEAGMAGLSRDILKWLQSLDLSYSVKNVKRDFANGFLIAEIFSRYFPYEVQMHSYDNGISLVKKLANWELLEKFFQRKRVPIGRDMIDRVIHCKGDAALPLLETVYTCLTSKKVQNVRARNEDELIPPFARATASFEIKQAIKDSELLTTLQDTSMIANRTSEVLQEHDSTVRQERLMEPGRFTAVSPQRSSQRVAPRPMQAEVPTGQIEFKEVQVRTLEKQNITQLRASRGGGGGGDVGGGGGATTLAGEHHHHVGTDLAVRAVKSVAAILEPCVSSELKEKLEVAGVDLSAPDPVVAMVEALISKKIGDAEGQTFLIAVSERVPALVDSFMAAPMEFWRFLHIFTNTLHLPDASGTYIASQALLCDVGTEMLERDSDGYLSAGLFVEYGLPKLCSLLSTRPSKRKDLLEVH